jgi:AraC-like DNA-binding protein
MAGALAIEKTASDLGISSRTLQRRLQREGVSYSEVVEKSRLEVSCIMLADPSMRVYEIATSMGFADPSSFSRAFRRWTGVSPMEYRKLLKENKSPPRLGPL